MINFFISIQNLFRQVAINSRKILKLFSLDPPLVLQILNFFQLIFPDFSLEVAQQLKKINYGKKMQKDLLSSARSQRPVGPYNHLPASL